MFPFPLSESCQHLMLLGCNWRNTARALVNLHEKSHNPEQSAHNVALLISPMPSERVAASRKRPQPRLDANRLPKPDWQEGNMHRRNDEPRGNVHEAAISRSIHERIRSIHFNASEFLESLDLGAPASSRTETMRVLNSLSADVNSRLIGCYDSMADGKLRTIETKLWLPFLESLRKDLRCLSPMIVGRSPGQALAVARLRATLELYRTPSAT